MKDTVQLKHAGQICGQMVDNANTLKNSEAQSSRLLNVFYLFIFIHSSLQRHL